MGAIRKPVTKIVEFEEHKEFSIRRITRVPEKLQTRAQHVDPEFSKFYAELKASGSPFPAVTLFHDPALDIDYLADGYTRVDAAESLGLRTIPAVVRIGNLQDAMLYGIQANLEVKTRAVTEADRRRAVEMMIRNGAGSPGEGTWDWGDSEIARRAVVSSPFVKRTRYRLNVTESIPIPDRVKAFSDGRFNGRTIRYTQRHTLEAITQNVNGNCTSQVNGQQLHFGNDIDRAEAALHEARVKHEENLGALKQPSYLAAWLRSRRINPEVLDYHSTSVGGLIIGNSAVYPASEADEIDILAAAMRTIVISAMRGDASRKIVIGYRGHKGGGRAIHLIALAGVEFMSPEEFVAEVGPKEPAAE